jgi:hypothetical protein
VITLLDLAALDEVVILEKGDFSNGFWRMLVQEANKQWIFAYAMPNLSGSPVHIILHAALQMG